MVTDQGSPWAYNGYEMTCYSNTEEMTNEMLFGSKLQFKVTCLPSCIACIIGEECCLRSSIAADYAG